MYFHDFRIKFSKLFNRVNISDILTSLFTKIWAI
jgi:hypothetical protein